MASFFSWNAFSFVSVSFRFRFVSFFTALHVCSKRFQIKTRFSFRQSHDFHDQFDFVSSQWCIDWVSEPLCEPNFFMYFWDPGWSLSTVTNMFNPLPPPSTPVVHATDRSKAVVPVLFLFCVALWLYYWVLHVLKSSHALCPRVLSFLLALWSPRLGKWEL